MCLGDIFDPDAPSLSNEAIVSRLLESTCSYSDFERSTESLGGRWLIFLRMGDESRVYPDATGSRPVYYHKDKFWVGGGPQIIAETLGLNKDSDLIEEFNHHTRSDWWPGGFTPYKDISHMWPNHFLRLNDMTIERFWPEEPIESVSIDDAATRIATILDGIIDGASRRYELHMALTGGYDSRTLLAASHALHEKIHFFTIHYPGIASFDLDTPVQLSEKFELDYRTVPLVIPDEGFLATFDRNVASMVEGQCRTNSMTYRSFPDKSLFLEGTASEIGRTFYYKTFKHPDSITEKSLCSRSGFADNSLAEKAFAEWLGSVPQDKNILILDLFYWEQRLGNWNAVDYVGQELTRNVMSPFNCRELLMLMLGTNLEARRDPYPLLRRVCEISLPGTLDIKFNYSLRSRIRHYCKWVLSRTKRVLGLREP